MNKQPLTQIDKKLKILNSLRPLSPHQVKNLRAFIDVNYTYHSNAIEGNTLSYSETKLILSEGLTIGGKSINEHLEAINHRDAIEMIEELSNQLSITHRDIKDIHSIILRAIDNQNAGRFRLKDVGVLKSDGSVHKFCSPLKVAEEMDSFLSWLESDTSHPIIKSALAHLKFVTIHPFSDGNGRTARLLMNLILLQSNYPITIIELKDRAEYIQAIEAYQESGDDTIFCRFIAQKVLDSFDSYFEVLDIEVIL